MPEIQVSPIASKTTGAVSDAAGDAAPTPSAGPPAKDGVAAHAPAAGEPDRRYRPVEGTDHPAPRFPLPWFHFMALAPLDVWARLLLGPGRPTRMGVRWWPRLGLNLATSALGTAMTLPERLALAPFLARARGSGKMRAASSAEGVGNGLAQGGAVAGVEDASGASTGAAVAAAEASDADPGLGDLIAILGYFRSGTTHLHYLLACDPRFITPRWYHTVAPHGFIASWTFLRVFLVPFISSRRPQDDVSLGPEWPAEDDFALNNAALASSLPGRLIAPSRWYWYQRFHDLQDLSTAEFRRWHAAQEDFLRRLRWADRLGQRLHRRERQKATGGTEKSMGSPWLLLKTPSHTARVPELQRLMGGPDRLRCIHISRKPEEVVRSNVAMLRRTLQQYGLEPEPDDATLEAMVIEEFVATEARYREARAGIPANRRIEIRFEDLRADPIGQVRAIYRTLELPLTDDVERRMLAYLESVRDYQQNRYPDRRSAPASATTRPSSTAGEVDRPKPTGTAATGDRLSVARARLSVLKAWFDHQTPAVPKVDPAKVVAAEPVSPLAPRLLDLVPRAAAASVGMVVAALVCAVVWVGRSWLTENRADWWVWPIGVVIGWVGIRLARVGSRGLGIVAACLTLAVSLAVAVPNTLNAHFPNRETTNWPLVLDVTWNEVSATNSLFWGLMGLFTAYRLASQTRTFPPLPHRRRPGRIGDRA